MAKIKHKIRPKRILVTYLELYSKITFSNKENCWVPGINSEKEIHRITVRR